MTARPRLLDRLAAAAAIVVLVACNLLARAHEAGVSHARDATDRAIHAQTIACDHGARAVERTHAHRLPTPIDRDAADPACDTIAFAHAAAHAAPAPTLAPTLPPPAARAPIVAIARVAAAPPLALLRVAPKTSPPA